MASTFTANIQLEEPARGDDVGTWDTPVNSNMTLLDRLFGITTIGLNNSNVTLAAAQFQSGVITFNSTLTGSVSITFPTSFTKPYIIRNLCTGSSAFIITLTTTAAGGQVIGCPPGSFECLNDGTNISFHNFGKIGEYWDYGGSSNPAWNSGCTVPPYLKADASTFSAATYPQLAVILGSTTLPDARGRVRAALNDGTARLSIASSVGSAGGDQNLQAHTHAVTGNTGVQSNDHTHGMQITNSGIFGVGANTAKVGAGGAGDSTLGVSADHTHAIAITSQSAGAGGSQNVQPTYTGGITLIRAA